MAVRNPPYKVVLCYFLTLVSLAQTKKNEAIFTRNMMKGSTNVSFVEKWAADSEIHCGRACTGLAQCMSFSFGSKRKHCTLYARRVTARDISPASSPEQEESFFGRVYGACPLDKNYTIIPGTQKCVRLNTNLQTWAQAQATCEAEGGQLLIIEDLNTCAAVRAYLEGVTTSPEYLYVGGFKSSTGQYLWLDGTTVEGDLWHPGEPQGHNCVSLWWGVRAHNIRLLDDIRCDNRFYSVCEM